MAHSIGLDISRDSFTHAIKMIMADVTEPEGAVDVTFDPQRGVLYVSIEGYTVLRICRMTKAFITVGDETREYQV